MKTSKGEIGFAGNGLRKAYQIPFILQSMYSVIISCTTTTITTTSSMAGCIKMYQDGVSGAFEKAFLCLEEEYK